MLPDFMVPFKHYSAEVISGVLDGIITPSDEDSMDAPCERTMMRWHQWLTVNLLTMEGSLRAIGYRELGFSEELLKSSISLLGRLRAHTVFWLESIIRFIYNSGGFLVPV